ncbi:MAG TPA: SCO family protein [Rudaea sp.]|nr:SCO family protein [Rudaea sp.]
MSLLRTLLASLLILAGGVAVLAAATDGFRAFTSETARRIDVREHPRALPMVALQTADGRAIDFAALRGRWLLVDFIYTRCMTYCSVQGGEFAQLQRDLAQPIAAGQVALLSISFDPAHDDPMQLAAYQRRSGDHGSGWIAARPVNTPDLDALMRVFGVSAVPDGLGGFVHNAAIAVVNPRGMLVAILDWDAPGEAQQFIQQRLEQ